MTTNKKESPAGPAGTNTSSDLLGSPPLGPLVHELVSVLSSYQRTIASLPQGTTERLLENLTAQLRVVELLITIVNESSTQRSMQSLTPLGRELLLEALESTSLDFLPVANVLKSYQQQE